MAVMLAVVAGCADPEPLGSEPSRSVTASPVVTSPVTTSPVTVAPVTVSPVVTSPVVTSPDVDVGACSPPSRGVSDIELAVGGFGYAVRIFVPASIGSFPAPVVLNFHGLGSDGTQQAAFSGYESLAEEEAFIVAHPTGPAAAPGSPNSWQLVDDGGPRDDLEFADALIDELTATWCGDISRVYATGMSNGGYFTARLVCERADRIAAGVSVAALTHPDDCSPDRPVPYRGYHGTDDRVVPYAGGDSVLFGPDVPDALRELFALSIRDEFEQFASEFGCDLPADESTIGADVTRLAYPACDAIPDLELFVVVGGGHTWPGSPLADALAGAGLGTFTDTVSATRDGWAFMSRHTLPAPSPN